MLGSSERVGSAMTLGVAANNRAALRVKAGFLQGIDRQYAVLAILDVLEGYFQVPNKDPNRQ
jgi:hypothetical protein